MPQQVRQGLVLIAVAAAVYFPQLGATRLWDDDETYFAQVAREMYDRGDLVVPWFNQALFAHKPPFMYWMMMGAYSVFGITEFAARLPSALFGIANVLLVWRLGRILYSPGAGFWAGIVLATSLNFVVIARAATCDAELMFFCTLAIYAYVRGTALRRITESGWHALTIGKGVETFDLALRSGSGRATHSDSFSGQNPDAASELTWDGGVVADEVSWRTWILVYATMGAAVMVKGPIGVVLPTAVLGLYRLWRRRPTESSAGEGKGLPQTNVEQRTSNVERTNHSKLEVRRSMFDVPGSDRAHALAAETTNDPQSSWRVTAVSFTRRFHPLHLARTIWGMRPLTALAVVLLVAGPWFVAVAIKTQGEFLTGFFGVHHFHRFTASMDNHAGPAWFYLAAICVGFFPWIIFLSPSLLELRRRFRESGSARPADILICSWFVVWVGFFSLATTKFPHYVVPAYPALALFTASFLDRWTRKAEIYGRLARNAAWGTVAVAGLGILIVVPVIADRYLQREPFLGIAGWPLLAGAGLCAWFTQRRQITRALASLTASAVLFLAAIFDFAAVRVDQHQNTPPFADTIRRHAPPEGARVATFGYFRPGLVYYCNERVEPLGEASTAAQFLHQNPGRGFLITTEAAYEQMATTLPPPIGVLDRGPWFLKQGQTLVVLGEVGGGRVSEQERANDRQRE